MTTTNQSLVFYSELRKWSVEKYGITPMTLRRLYCIWFDYLLHNTHVSALTIVRRIICHGVKYQHRLLFKYFQNPQLSLSSRKWQSNRAATKTSVMIWSTYTQIGTDKTREWLSTTEQHWQAKPKLILLSKFLTFFSHAYSFAGQQWPDANQCCWSGPLQVWSWTQTGPPKNRRRRSNNIQEDRDHTTDGFDSIGYSTYGKYQ